jgi:hypothetical protein
MQGNDRRHVSAREAVAYRLGGALQRLPIRAAPA